MTTKMTHHPHKYSRPIIAGTLSSTKPLHVQLFDLKLLSNTVRIVGE